MVVEGMEAEEAVNSVRIKRKVVQPNDGFLQQLAAWQEMGAKLDKSHPYVKQKALDALAQQQLAGDTVEKQDLAIPEEQNQPQETLYRCRKCRRLVATSANAAPSYQRIGKQASCLWSRCSGWRRCLRARSMASYTAQGVRPGWEPLAGLESRTTGAAG